MRRQRQYQQRRQKEWFLHWFNSHFYPLVYQHRDHREATIAIGLFLKSCSPPKGAKILDLCCGTGRHAIPLAQMGYAVTGLDISSTLLQYARERAQHLPTLQLVQQDMRLPFPDPPYDAILNLFTSFGYFDTIEEDRQVLHNVATALNSSGYFFFDYLNVPYTLRMLQPENTQSVAGMRIHQQRRILGNRIQKSITITDASGVVHQFEEQVRLYTLQDFENLFRAVGLTIEQRFGDYQGAPYDPERSPRLILVARKTA